MIDSTRDAALKPVTLQFYHCAAGLVARFVLAVAGVIVSATLMAAVPDLEPAKAPPRTIDDLTRLLEHYKPDPAAAAKARTAADMPALTSTDTRELFNFYAGRAQAAANLGRVSQQIRDYRKAIEYVTSNSKEEIQAFRDLSTAEVIGGNLLRSIQAAENAIARTDRTNLGQALGAYQQLAQLYVLVGDFDKAEAALRQVEATYTALGSTKNWPYFHDNWNANLERARGEIFRAQGRMVEAEAAYRKALRSLEAFHTALRGGMQAPNFTAYDMQRSERFREVLLKSLAQALMAQGKNIDAEIALRRALRYALERVGRDAPATASTLMQLSNCLGEQGRFKDAARLAEEALKSFEQAGTTPESLFMANARRALASTYVAQARYKEALALFDQMQNGLNGDPLLAQRLASGDLDWVLALLRTDDSNGAERMAKTLLDNALKRKVSGSRLAEIQAFHGMTLAAGGQYDAALAAFKLAVPTLIESRRNDEEAGTGSVKRQQRLIAVIESYLNLLFESTRNKPAELAQAASESFVLADVARGSSVQQALTASAARASISDPALADLARREQDAQRRIGALGEILTQLLAAPPEQQLPQVQSKMREDVDALKVERSKLKKEIEQRFPEYAELIDPKPATLAQAQKLLKPDEALVAWYFGEQGGWVWAVNKQGNIGFNVVPYNRKQIAQAVQGLRKSLDPGVASIDDIPAFDVAQAYQLFSGLLQPVAAEWQGAQNLLAISHADLGQLPLALLPTASVAQPGKSATPFTAYRSVPWLARQIAVTQLPSVTALASLRRLPAPSAERRSFIGFGDPLFNTDQAKQADKVAQA
ncbi:MAG TPA: tetratricopeptide repeat protein, partial [Rhodocyclaceae bacterium]|nr:tetratricopeptide repeat protein [Rhodocyclaceae bacterium]